MFDKLIIKEAIKAVPIISPILLGVELKSNASSLAHILGVNRSQVGRWLKGQAKPYPKYIWTMKIMVEILRYHDMMSSLLFDELCRRVEILKNYL